MFGFNKRSGKLAAAAATTAAGALFLSACSAAGAADDRTVVEVMSWAGQSFMDDVIEWFEYENPDIRINFSFAAPVAPYVQALQSRINAQNTPDVFMMVFENRTQLMDAGLTRDLSDQAWLSRLHPSAVEFYTTPDGHVHTAATDAWAGGIVYNVDILAAHGIETPFASMDDFIAAAHTLNAAGYIGFLESFQGMPMTVNAHVGRHIYNLAQELGTDPDQLVFDGLLTFEEIWGPPLTDVMRLFEEGVLDETVVGIHGVQVEQEFTAGRVAMMTTGPWAINAIREQGGEDFNFRFTSIPTRNAGENFWGGAMGVGLSVYVNTEVEEAALRFVEFMTTPIVMARANEDGPITTTADFDPVVDYTFLEAYHEALLTGNFYLPMGGWVRFQDELYTQATALLQEMVMGIRTPAEVGRGLDQELARHNN